MSQRAVDDILDRIRQLTEEERLQLEQRLEEWTEAEWAREAAAAREEARRRGIDQAAIDRAVDELRYGS